MQRELLRVAGTEEVLPVEIGHGHALFAPLVKDVQAAVRVFLEAVEDGQVVLVAIGRPVAEQAEAEVGVGEDEAAEIAGERLDAGAEGNEIVVRPEVSKFALVEEL